MERVCKGELCSREPLDKYFSLYKRQGTYLVYKFTIFLQRRGMHFKTTFRIALRPSSLLNQDSSLAYSI